MRIRYASDGVSWVVVLFGAFERDSGDMLSCRRESCGEARNSREELGLRVMKEAGTGSVESSGIGSGDWEMELHAKGVHDPRRV